MRVHRPLYKSDRLEISYSRRSADEHMGRFGGGWQWIVGFEASEGFRTIILNLLVCMVRIERKQVERSVVMRQCPSRLFNDRCDLSATSHFWHQYRKADGGTLTWSDETPGARRA